MTQHVLRCSCGAELCVRSTQAGETITCPQCGGAVAIPSLRELRDLPPPAAAPQPRFGFLPRKSLPPSPAHSGLGIVFLAVACLAPLLVALELFENAFSYTDPADPRRTFFKLDNLAFWAGLAALAFSGLLCLLRGRGYRIRRPPS